MEASDAKRESKMTEDHYAGSSETKRTRKRANDSQSVTPEQKLRINAKKKKSSEKEKVRNQSIKVVLDKIRDRVPYVEKNLSKIRTLRLATKYIGHLQRILNGDMVDCEFSGARRPLMMGDFEHVVMKEMQITNSYKERAEVELTGSQFNSPSSSSLGYQQAPAHSSSSTSPSMLPSLPVEQELLSKANYFPLEAAHIDYKTYPLDFYHHYVGHL